MPKKEVEMTLMLASLDQLLTTTDPETFHAKGVDDDAHTYIFGEANKYILTRPAHLLVSLPKKEVRPETEKVVQTILHNFFAYQQLEAERSIHRMFWQGRISFVVAVLFILACMTLAFLIHDPDFSVFWRDIMVAGLTIAAWVALWQPIEIFLYDWWPIRRDIQVYRKLSQMDIRVVGR